MVWYDKPNIAIRDSEFAYCYCELLLVAEDLMLQGFLDYTLDDTWILSIQAYESDGTTLIGNITSFFSYFYAEDDHSNPYFVAKLSNFPTNLCGKCFMLHVVISKGQTRAFDQWTDIYCIGSCCQIVTGTTIVGDNGIIPYTSEPLPIVDSIAQEKCSRNIVRIEGVYDCNDNFGGGFYGDPTNITGGNSPGGFQFRRVSNIAATFQRGKREITKEISLNCRTQKVTSVKNYELQSFEIFPAWKVEELEDLLCAPYVKIDGAYFLYYGGDDPFTIVNPRSCNYKYKFKATFKDCSVWQIFGCDSKCDTDNDLFFGFLKQSSAYYNENSKLIGNTIEDVENYLKSQNGTYSVVEKTPTVGDNPRNPYYKILEVKSKGVVPAYIYDGHVGIDAKVYGVPLNPVNPDYNSLFNVSSCALPILGTITFVDLVCAMPIIGTVTYSDSMQISDRVHSYQDWIVSDMENVATRTDNQVQLTFTTSNSTLFVNPEQLQYTYAIVGYVLNDYAPSQQRIINHEMNASIPLESQLVINTDGSIQYSGALPFTSGVPTLTFTDINYLL